MIDIAQAVADYIDSHLKWPHSAVCQPADDKTKPTRILIQYREGLNSPPETIEILFVRGQSLTIGLAELGTENCLEYDLTDPDAFSNIDAMLKQRLQFDTNYEC